MELPPPRRIDPSTLGRPVLAALLASTIFVAIDFVVRYWLVPEPIWWSLTPLLFGYFLGVLAVVQLGYWLGRRRLDRRFAWIKAPLAAGVFAIPFLFNDLQTESVPIFWRTLLAAASCSLLFVVLTEPPGLWTPRLFVLAIAGMAILPVAVGAWRAAFNPARSTNDYDWEQASSHECPLMLQALHAVKPPDETERPPLIGRARQGGPCDWSGEDIGRLTMDEFQASAGPRLEGPYFAHTTLGRPVYSLLRLRAWVPVGYAFGGLAARGQLCEFRPGRLGWKLHSCPLAWVS